MGSSLARDSNECFAKREIDRDFDGQGFFLTAPKGFIEGLYPLRNENVLETGKYH